MCERVLCGRSRGSVFQTGLPLWARNRGSKDPRLLRDRPTDGAALVCKNICGREGYAGCGGNDWPCGDINGARSSWSVFQTGLPLGQETEGLKTPAIERPSYGRGCIVGQKFMRAGRAKYCGSLVDYGCCKTMRKTVPLHVGKCRGGHLQLPAPLKTQIFKRVRRSRCAFRP